MINVLICSTATLCVTLISLLETEVWTKAMTEMIIQNDAISLADHSQSQPFDHQRTKEVESLLTVYHLLRVNNFSPMKCDSRIEAEGRGLHQIAVRLI